MAKFFNLYAGLGLGAALAALASGSAVQAGTDTDADYLAALNGIVAQMELAELAEQTFEPQSYVAPVLFSPVAAQASGVVDCNTVSMKAAERGVPLEIFGPGTAIAQEQLAAVSECALPGSGILVSYFLPES